MRYRISIDCTRDDHGQLHDPHCGDDDCSGCAPLSWELIEGRLYKGERDLHKPSERPDPASEPGRDQEAARSLDRAESQRDQDRRYR